MWGETLLAIGLFGGLAYLKLHPYIQANAKRLQRREDTDND